MLRLWAGSLVACPPVIISEEESKMPLTEEEIQEAQAEEAASMLETEETVIEDDCEDADAYSIRLGIS